ncbi:MAG: energy-coupling factor transporter ATPase [Candidatus Caldatribacteriota bacterium]|nr:energy-coupling factor transporter ATPase [Candidatus Caldatribacteriota bacterium]
MIKIKKLSHIYNSQKKNQIKALDNINLEIEDGDFITIIGSNGSGKSTLARHLNCLLLPTFGDVWVDGLNTKDKEKIWEIRKKVGMVFQNPDNQIVATTVEDDIAFGLENIGLSKEVMEKRVEWALKIIEMEEYKKSEPHLLSGGQKQRVAIAGAIAMHSSYLVLDEPTAMLDPSGRDEVMDIVKKLNKKEKIAIIYITHLMEEAVESKRIVVLDKGKIALEDKPREVFKKYDILKKIRLDIPQITELAFRLNKKGLDIPTDILKVNEMVDRLCLYV